MDLELYNKAKAEFEEAFNAYAAYMYKLNGTVYEKPELYYSEKLALKGKPQVQTRYYLEKAKETSLLLKKSNK